ncbi:hypothetical protein FIBSPDRAFT_854917 [Athelia psychrophila]|uniref:Uncharacterized protein n=1 Tax=Athelia psychrophila TaxID=1759441 RepID=A0A166PP04_9AGAM|nr:hypothetical protein FIBSPDRAFT_854917 [Fibularhizoctonia sp. CBS 109695]
MHVVIGCVDLSYPNLHYLSYLVATDMEARHLPYMARAALPGAVPFFFLDYAKFSNGASGIILMDANDKKPWFPLSDDGNLSNEWRRLLVGPKELVPRLLVAIPRGAKDTAQMMTAAVVLAQSSASQNPMIGLRWFHCQ